jgi:hypothetical protein
MPGRRVTVAPEQLAENSEAPFDSLKLPFIERRRSLLVDLCCSVRASILLLVAVMCITIALVCIFWGLLTVTIASYTATTLRQHLIDRITDIMEDKLIPIKMSAASLVSTKKNFLEDSMSSSN